MMTLGEGDPTSERRLCQRGANLIHAINALERTTAVETFRYADRYEAMLR
jgi:hypothetical protein